MPFKWREVFQQQNELEKAKAERAVQDHADPKDQLALAVRQLQDQHDALEHSCSVVIAQAKTLGEKVEADLAQERALTARAQAAMQANHKEAAAAIAQQIVSIRNTLATEQPTYDKAKAAADQAQAAFQENTELLKQKMDEAKQLNMEIDQAAMEHNINQAMAAVNSQTSHVIPSFDSVADKVHAQRAQEEADASLTGTDSQYSAVHDAHLADQAAADDVLAQLASSASTPLTAASLPSPPSTSSGSLMDQL